MLDFVLDPVDKLVTKDRCLDSHYAYVIFLDINQIVTLVMYNCKPKGTLGIWKNITNKLEVIKEGLPWGNVM